MIIAIQQPEHIPWIGFFNKLFQCDIYVYLDNVQFKKRYFENRNRIKTRSGVNWLTVPVCTRGKYHQHINEVMISENDTWKNKYIGLLEHSYKKAPYWNDVKKLIFPFIDNNTSLVHLNIQIIEQIKQYLQIKTKTIVASTLGLNDFSSSKRILEICSQLGATVYISGPDGRNYLNQSDFTSKNINVCYHDYIHPIYKQMYGDFESHMSIIDLIANCGLESKNIVRQFKIMEIFNNE